MAKKPVENALFRSLLTCLLAFSFLLTAFPAHAFFGGNSGGNEFLPVDEAFPFTAWVDDGELVLDWQVTPEHYLYRERINVSVEPEDAVIDGPVFSIESQHKDDPYFGAVQVFYNDVQGRLAITLPEGAKAADVRVTWQGCAEAGLCYPPETERIRFDPVAGVATHPYDGNGTGTRPQSTATAGTGTSQPGTADERFSFGGLQNVLAHDSLLTIALVFYVLGLGLTFTPCVLPMIPIISAVVAGQRQLTTPQAFGLSLSYVLGMALTYAAAGVLVGLLGASFNVQAYLQSPWVLGAFALLFALFALAMFGVFEIRMPQALQDRLTSQSQKLSGGRVASVFGIGSLSALVVSPCVTAPLAAALVYISATQDAAIGGTALLALGLGMGTFLLVVGTGGQRFMPKAGPWMNGVKALFGVLMLGVAIWLLERVIPGPVALGLWSLLFALSGVQLGAFEAMETGWGRTRKGLGLVLFVVGVMLLAGALAGGQDPLRPLAPFQASTETSTAEESDFERIEDSARVEARLAQASENNQPVILDLYADWCVSCKIMERRVFSDPEVAAEMASFVRLQVDVTHNNAADRALLEDYGLFGPPSLVFFDGEGKEIEGSRVVGEMNRRQFLSHMESVNSGARL